MLWFDRSWAGRNRRERRRRQRLRTEGRRGMGSGTRCRRPFLRMVRNTVYGRAGRDAVKAAVAWIRPLRSLDAFENARLWSAPSGAGASRARSSAEEHCLHTAGVAGSNPAAPTMGRHVFSAAPPAIVRPAFLISFRRATAPVSTKCRVTLGQSSRRINIAGAAGREG